MAVAGVGAAAALAAVVVVGLTGALTVVITHGDSMQPTYRAGDLVVVARADTYTTGDVAAYRSPLLGQVVLHRIVGSEDDGLVLSGDNNDWLDPDRPTADELLGTARLHVPRLGVPIRWLGAHTGLAALGVIVLLAATATTARATTAGRRNRPMKPTARVPHEGGLARQLTAGLLAGLLACGLLAAVAWSRPTMAAGPVDYTHHGAFTYTATAAAAPGPVYDTPRVSTGDPLFLALVDDVRVGLSYRFSAAQPAAIRGTIGLRATVDNATGWSRTLQLAPPRSFDGQHAQTAGDLDVAQIRTLVAEAAAATGESGATTITLHPHVTIDGDIAGQPLQARFTPSLAYQLTGTQLRALHPTGGEDTEAFQARQSGQLAVPEQQPAVLSWAGRAIDAAAARTLSLAGVAACAAGLLALLIASKRTTGHSETEHILRRWPQLIAAGHVDGLLPAAVVRVADMTALATLAQRSNRLIIHDPTANRFLVDLDGTRYHYTPTAPTLPPPGDTPATAPPSDPPAAPRPAAQQHHNPHDASSPQVHA